MTTMHHTEHAPPRSRAMDLQKVVVVDGNPQILELLESVLDAGRYDMVFVEASAHAYSRIRNVQPDLVILCMRIDEVEGFHLLSMLKLDVETQRIPVVTYTNEMAPDEDDDLEEVSDGDEFPIVRPTVTMN
jgi:PleD family two-component response regulator